MELIATCAFGLEKIVYDEIKKLGLWVIKTEDGRVTFEGDELALVKANLWLRCADRILIKVGEFHAETFDELFDQTTDFEWENAITKNDVFPVDATSVKSALHSEPAIQSIVKKAIVTRLQKQYKTEILPENSGATYQIIVKANKDQFLLAIDSSGDSLHKRGYRTKANQAPMKETLAAALVKLSDWTPDRPLYDTFCGSGTIGIEAALIAKNIAPGLKREFTFHSWPWIDKNLIEECYQEAKKSIRTDVKLNINCSELDPETTKIAESNAKNAGCGEIKFQTSDFRSLDFSKFENSTFISNPPYGERLDERSSVEKMYRQFGEKFSQTKGCSLFLITSNENFPYLFGRPADKNRKLFNGNIRCYLFMYF